MEDVILQIAQFSAALTTGVGIMVLIQVFMARLGLSKDRFKDTITGYIGALALIVIGTGSMAAYHMTEGTNAIEFGEVLENAWYVFMILGLIVSCINSQQVISFGKALTPRTRRR